jgi:mannose/fructose/N-acetylgalactosamine-specific phosphotransferase system component IIC
MIDFGLITTAALLVALISLDHTAVGQVMISQPLVGGWLLGAAFGSPMEGLAVGALLQLLCLTELPVGASIPPDGSLAGLTGAAFFLIFPRSSPWTAGAVMGLAVLLFFPMAYLGRSGEMIVRRLNRVWTDAALSRIVEGRLGAAQAACLGGALLFFVKAFVVSWLLLGFFTTLLAGDPAWAAYLVRPLEVLARLAPFAGLGIIAARYRRRRSSLAVTAGLIAGLLLCWRCV